MKLFDTKPYTTKRQCFGSYIHFISGQGAAISLTDRLIHTLTCQQPHTHSQNYRDKMKIVLWKYRYFSSKFLKGHLPDVADVSVTSVIVLSVKLVVVKSTSAIGNSNIKFENFTYMIM